MSKILRNIAIIAHVDHGKTTLVDCLLKQSGQFRDNERVAERAMDSNDIERERGITILAKVTSVEWKDTRINIVDTPGHADFGGEVERILSMVDGVVLLVDAAEGPMPQTKFVLTKALALGMRPIVLINKVDKPDGRADWVLDETFDLFAALDATEEQLEFPVLYASSKQGWATDELEDERTDMAPLFNKIIEHVPAPNVDSVDEPFRMLATTIEANPFLGRILTGRIQSGTLTPNMAIKALGMEGNHLENGRATKILAFRGLERQPIETAQAGDIIAIAGLTKATVADTLCAPEVTTALKAQPIDPPTLSMTFSVNDSPLAGLSGDKVTSRLIWDRLQKEAEGNVALQVSETDGKDAFEVAGRGELQLAVLIENMRREGFELSVSRPRVVYQRDENGNRLEPFEEVTVDVDCRLFRCCCRENRHAQRRAQGHAAIGWWQAALVFHRAVACSDRLFGRVPHRYPRHGHSEPALQPLWSAQRHHSGPTQRRTDLDGKRHFRCFCAVEPRRPRPAVHSAPAAGLSGFDHW